MGGPDSPNPSDIILERSLKETNIWVTGLWSFRPNIVYRPLTRAKFVQFVVPVRYLLASVSTGSDLCGVVWAGVRVLREEGTGGGVAVVSLLLH